MPTIGRAEIDVHYNGEDLPEEAERLGHDTGERAGEEHAKEFDKKAQDGFDKTSEDLRKKAGKGGDKSGGEYGDRFGKALRTSSQKDIEKFAAGIDDVFKDTKGIDRYGDKIGGLETDFHRAGQSVDELSSGIQVLRERALISQETFEHHRDALQDYALKAEGAEGRTKNLAGALDTYLNRLGVSGPDAQKLRDLGDDVSNFGTKAERGGTTADRGVGGIRRITDALKNTGSLALGGIGEKIEEVGTRSERGGTSAERGVRGFRLLADGLDGLIDKIGRGGAKLAGDLLGIGNGADDGGKKAGAASGGFGKLFSTFSNFDPGDNIGQLIAIIIAFAPQIAVLASAAGGGLLILAGAATAVGLAAVGFGVGFSNMFGDLKKVDPAVRPAAKSLQDFLGDFKDVRAELQKTLFANMVGEFDKLRTTLIPELKTDFAGLGTTLNQVLKGMTTDLASSGFKKDLQAIFTEAKPVILDLGTIARNTFGIIGALLEDVLPDTHDFTKGVGDALGKFNEFLRSPEGKTAVHDFLSDAKKVLGELGGIIGTVSEAFGKLVANPKNLNDTVDSLKALASAGPALLQLGQNLGTLAAGAVQAINIISHVAEGASRILDPIISGVEVGFVIITEKLQELATTIHNVIFLQIKTAMDGFGGIASAVSKAVTGDFSGAAAALGAASKRVQDDVKATGDSFSVLGGNTATFFDTLDRNAQSHLTSISSRFGLSGDDAKKFGGAVAQVARQGGVDLSTLDQTGGSNLASISRALGITETAAKVLLGGFLDTANGGKGAFTALQAAAATNLGTISSKLGLTGRDADTFKNAVVTSTNGSDSALKGLAGAKSWGDIGNALSTAGNKSKTDFANKIISAANDSGFSIDKLPPKIQSLVGTYGTIPVKKNTDVTLSGAEAARAAADSVKGRIDALSDKIVTVTVRVNQPGKGGIDYAVGGIIAGGQRIAGGRPHEGALHKFALGGVVRRPTLIGRNLVGEAGAEAIVPLTGPLDRVDKSVRYLASVARGMQPAQAPVAGGRQNYFAEGAIQVRSNTVDGTIVAGSVIDKLNAVVGNL